LIASVTARETTYCKRGNLCPSSICTVKESKRQPIGDSHTFFALPVNVNITKIFINIEGRKTRRITSLLKPDVNKYLCL